MEERQLLLHTLEQEEKEALALVEKRKRELDNWKNWYASELPVNENRLSFADRKLKEVRERMEKAKKDKDPALTISLDNQQRAADRKLRFSKGCAVMDDDVAAAITDNQVLMAEIFSLPIIHSGPYTGLPIVCNLLSQLVSNALLIPVDKLKHVTPKEVQLALSKWPKKK